MYYSLYDDEDPQFDICFNSKDISTSYEVNKEIERLFSYMIGYYKEENIPFYCCGIMPCISLFINEFDLLRLYNCTNDYSRRNWSIKKPSIDILDDYVCVMFGAIFWEKVKDKYEKLKTPRATDPYFIIKYSDFINCFNRFRYKAEDFPKTFGELKYDFLMNRSQMYDSDKTPEPRIVYYNSPTIYDSKEIDFARVRRLRDKKTGKY